MQYVKPKLVAKVSENKLSRHNFWRSLHIDCICAFFYTFYSQKGNKSAFPLANAHAAVRAITDAIKEYHNKTCIIFKERTEKKEPAYIEFFYGFGWVCYWDVEAYLQPCETSKMEIFLSEGYSELCQVFKMARFTKIVNG